MDEGKIRAFLAVPSDAGWVESARGLASRLRETLPEASWTRPASWHLTLKFLGDISRDQAREFAEAVGPEATATAPGEILCDRAVVFPPRGPARVLSVGFAASETLEGIARLAREAEQAARRLGLSQEKRQFHAHVTLARLRRPWPREAVESFRREVEGWRFPVWLVRSCVLYESRLDPDGAIHTPIQEWSFSGSSRCVGR